MTFCDKEYVRNIFKDKTVAIVGSGPSVLDNRPGYIDSHDIVVKSQTTSCMKKLASEQMCIIHSMAHQSKNLAKS